MESLAHATRLIDASDTPDGRAALLRELGFPDPPLTLDADAVERLGLGPDVESAEIAASIGSLRALIVALHPATDPRQSLHAIARALAARVPQLSWLLIVIQRESPLLAVATWLNESAHPSLFTLMTERGASVDSDAETLCALAACSSCEPDTLRKSRWNDTLGRVGISKRFFHALRRSIATLSESLAPTVPRAAASELALLASSRLLFISFLETKGWMNGDFTFLANGFADCVATGGRYQSRILDPLFFGTLNTPRNARAASARAFGKIPFLNGGLFSRTYVERIHRRSRFSDEAFGTFFDDVLTRYRFTAREDARTWSQAAVDPEMLGKAFESLMARAERKRNGVFYTPHGLVQRLVHETLRSAITARVGPVDIDASFAGHPLDRGTRAALVAATSTIRILDPACGSGAFLVHALERLAAFRIINGDQRPVAEVRRDLLVRSIFGVDINPTAVWLCQLRLWLSVVVESEQRDPALVLPLPNLDRQIRAGDSLAGSGFEDVFRSTPGNTLHAARARYARATGVRKTSLARDLDARERRCALAVTEHSIARHSSERRELVAAARSPDLFRARAGATAVARRRMRELRGLIRELRATRTGITRGDALPFAYPVHFADVAARGGFDVVLGNPPWVRPHNVARAERIRHRRTFHVARASVWRGGPVAPQSSGFAAQVDLAALFVERAHGLLDEHGVLGFLLPAKLWRSLAGAGVRQLVQERTQLSHLENVDADAATFEAAAYPALLVAKREHPSAPRSPGRVAVQRGDTRAEWHASPGDLALDGSPGAPWVLLDPASRSAFDLLASVGEPLARTHFGRPALGTKTGCNSAFIVELVSEDAEVSTIRSGGRTGSIESRMLRRVVRGETLTRWTLAENPERIVWTDSHAGRPMRELPPLTHEWLTAWRRTLERRTDVRGQRRWWSLFRTEIAYSDLARVAWADFGRSPRAATIRAGDPTVPLNTCYAVTAPSDEDAVALTTLLNSRVAKAWLAPVAEPARGHYRRFLSWTMSRFPIPRDWDRARKALAPIGATAVTTGDDENRLTRVVCDCYGIDPEQIAALLEWKLG